MERFFIITDECNYKKDFIEYKHNAKIVNEKVKEFFLENEIEAKEYAIYDNKIHIIPTSKDIEKFKNYLNNPLDNGLMAFKKNGIINKNFHKMIESNGLKILNRPSLWMYMNGYYGSFSTSTYEVNGEIYLKVSTGGEKEISEKGFNQISGVEFYKAIESI